MPCKKLQSDSFFLPPPLLPSYIARKKKKEEEENEAKKKRIFYSWSRKKSLAYRAIYPNRWSPFRHRNRNPKSDPSPAHSKEERERKESQRETEKKIIIKKLSDRYRQTTEERETDKTDVTRPISYKRDETEGGAA